MKGRIISCLAILRRTFYQPWNIQERCIFEMIQENGSTDIWLGTHDGFGSTRMEDGMSLSSGAGGIIKTQLKERMMVRPPSRPVIPNDAVVFRDIRL